MIGDAVGVVGTNINHTQAFDEKLRKFVHARDEQFNGFDQRLVAGEHGGSRIEVTYHTNTGRRRRDNDLGLLEYLDEVAKQLDGLALIAGVIMHLPAARLCLGKVHSEVQSLQQSRGGNADLGKERVVEASDEERDSHRLILSIQGTCEEDIALKRCSASFHAAC